MLEYLAQFFLIAAAIFTIEEANDNAQSVYSAFKNADNFAGLHFLNGVLVIGITTLVLIACAALARLPGRTIGLTALLFLSGRQHDLNIRGAFLHMAADAAISAGVVIAGLAILFTGRHWIDPIVSLLICAVIVWGTWDLLRESVNLALQAVPALDRGLRQP